MSAKLHPGLVLRLQDGTEVIVWSVEPLVILHPELGQVRVQWPVVLS